MNELMNRVVVMSSMFSIAVAGTACIDVAAGGEEAGGEAVAETEQAASWGGFASWAREDNLPASDNLADIGSDANMTCFLSGFAGNIRSMFGAQAPQGQLYSTSSAGVFRSGGRWFIEAFTGSGTERLKAMATCVNITAGRTGTFSWNGGPAAQMLPVAPGRRCFLTQIHNLAHWTADDDFTASTDELRVWNDGVHWYIGGNGNAHGVASCINVTVDKGEWLWHGPTTQNLAYNDMTPGTQCFLTGVKGVFRNNDWSNGVFINYNAGLNQYTMTVSSGKSGRARCIE